MATTTKQNRELAKIGRDALDSIRDLARALDAKAHAEWYASSLKGAALKKAAVLCGHTPQSMTADEMREAIAEALVDGSYTPDEIEIDEEKARERIHEAALEVTVRSGWESSASEFTAQEFCILITTGGPAVRIRGELDNGEPSRAWLEVQDWGTPWIEHVAMGEDHAAVMAYARQFYFGE